jgi:hypothetical protein
VLHQPMLAGDEMGHWLVPTATVDSAAAAVVTAVAGGKAAADGVAKLSVDGGWRNTALSRRTVKVGVMAIACIALVAAGGRYVGGNGVGTSL